MKRILKKIETAAAGFEERPLFSLLEGEGTRSDVDAMVPGLTFFILAFQDMLRLNESHIKDPELKKIALQQRRDDAGHETWFLRDLARLELTPSLGWLFGRQHEVTRDVSYDLLFEVKRASDDRVRIAIPLVLEATGAAYFKRVHRFARRSGLEMPLEFFGEKHWEVEQSHQMFEAEEQAILSSIELSPTLYQEADEMVARMFTQFDKLVESMNSSVERSRQARDQRE